MRMSFLLGSPARGDCTPAGDGLSDASNGTVTHQRASAPITSCHQARAAASVLGAPGAGGRSAGAGAGRRARAAGRCTRSGRPRAHERAAAVAARAELLGDRHAVHLAREAGVAVVLGPRARAEHRRSPSAAAARGAAARPTGPRASARAGRRISSATSSRTSTCSRSPASIRVDPRGSSASSPRTITLSSASRGSPSSRTQLADDRVVRARPGTRRPRRRAAGPCRSRPAAAAAPARWWSRRACARAARTSCPAGASRPAPRRRRC